MVPIIKSHPGEYRVGRYFATEPVFPLTEPGRYFRYKLMPYNESQADMANNLEYRNEQRTIKTSYNLEWHADSFVVINDTVYVIRNVTCEAVHSFAGTIKKKETSIYTLNIEKVNDKVGFIS